MSQHYCRHDKNKKVIQINLKSSEEEDTLISARFCLKINVEKCADVFTYLSLKKTSKCCRLCLKSVVKRISLVSESHICSTYPKKCYKKQVMPVFDRPLTVFPAVGQTLVSVRF